MLNLKCLPRVTGGYYEPIVQMLHTADLFLARSILSLLKIIKITRCAKQKLIKPTLLKLPVMALTNGLYTKALKNTNLITLLDQTYPGVNAFFTSSVRKDDHQNWMDFATTFRHLDEVRSLSLNAFTQQYHKWCKCHSYSVSSAKDSETHYASKKQIAILPENSLTKMLIQQSIQLLNALFQSGLFHLLEMKNLSK